MSEHATALRETIETIERSYEYMLAYAAQGHDFEETGGGPIIRDFLTELNAALLVVGDHATACGEKNEAFGAFSVILAADAEKSASAVALALAVPSISSQLIDNLNASIHLRALLTDLFLFDEAYKGL